MTQQLEATVMPGPEENGVAARTLAKGGALQQVRTTYATAVYVQRPRELVEVQRRLLEEARLAGEDFYYGWGSGKDAVEGKSVKLAMAAARCFGNCAVEALPVQDLPDAWVFTAAFVDLETGFTLTRQFRQSKKWMVYGKFDPERKDDIRFQIGQSKASRNVILNAIPETILRRAQDEAKAGVRAAIEVYIKNNSLPKAVDYIIDALAKVGVSEQMILDRIGKAGRAGMDVDDLVILRGNLAALQNGQERVEVLFPAKEEPKGEEGGNSRAAEILSKAGARKPTNGAATAVPSQSTPTAPPPPPAQPEHPTVKLTEEEQLQIEDFLREMNEDIAAISRSTHAQSAREKVTAATWVPEAFRKTLIDKIREKELTLAPGAQQAAKPPRRRLE